MFRLELTFSQQQHYTQHIRIGSPSWSTLQVGASKLERRNRLGWGSGVVSQVCSPEVAGGRPVSLEREPRRACGAAGLDAQRSVATNRPSLETSFSLGLGKRQSAYLENAGEHFR